MGLILALHETLRIYENVIPILKEDSIIDCIRDCGQTAHSSVSCGLSIAHSRGNIVVKNMVSKERPSLKLKLAQLLAGLTP